MTLAIVTLLHLYAAAADDLGLPSWARGIVAIVASLVTLVGTLTAAVISIRTARQIGHRVKGDPAIAQQVKTAADAAPVITEVVPALDAKVTAVVDAVHAEPPS